MNSFNKENITQLSKHGVRDFMEKKRKGVVLQLVEIQKLNNNKGAAAPNSDKFR